MPSPVTVPRYTIQDLESFQEDGNRYELLDRILRAGEAGETRVDDRLTWLPPGMAEPLVIDVLDSLLRPERTAPVSLDAGVSAGRPTR